MTGLLIAIAAIVLPALDVLGVLAYVGRKSHKR